MAFGLKEPHPWHREHLSLAVASAALAVTFAFHGLIADVPYGFSFAVFVLLLVVAMHAVVAFAGQGGNAWAYLFLIPVAFGVIAESLYASDVVRVVAFPLALVSLAFFAYWKTSPSVPFRELKSLWPLSLAWETLFPLKALEDFFAELRVSRHLVRVVFGAMLALPLLFLFGLLFASADPLFGKSVAGVLDIASLPATFGKLLRDSIVFFFLLGAGWAMLTRGLAGRRPRFHEDAPRFDRVVLTTLLTLVNALFAVFLAFQFLYFFGGTSVIEERGISYADYARSGFFQLLTVAGVVFAVVWAMYRMTDMRERISRGLSALLILQTGVVIVSALTRLALYVDVYGLTVARWWAAAVILLIAGVLLWVLLCGMVGRRYAYFARTTFVGVLIVVSGLLLLNVEGYVVAANAERFLTGKTERLDISYFSGLSTDAVPQLVSLYQQAWPTEIPVDSFVNLQPRLHLASQLRDSVDGRAEDVSEDWRTGAVADYRAIAAVSILPSRETLDEQLRRLSEERRRKSASVSVQGTKNIDYQGYGWTTLVGFLPEEVDGDLILRNNHLRSLEGLPKTIGGYLDLSYNDLTSLAGMPDAIGGHLNLSRNPLLSLEGLPKTIGGTLYLYDVPAKSIPAGISIKYKINVQSWQVELIADARAKGYGVYVAEEMVR